jgi:hypothetical protein
VSELEGRIYPKNACGFEVISGGKGVDPLPGMPKNQWLDLSQVQNLHISQD